MSRITRKQIGELQEAFVKAGIMRDPMSYSAQELKDLNPGVPRDFIDDYVNVRDGKKKYSKFTFYRGKLDV